MYVNKIIDPRGPLDKFNRDELYAYAKANGITEIDEKMYLGAYAAIRMREILAKKNITGLESRLPPSQADKLAELPQEPLAPRFDIATATRAELAKECKRRGIKMARTDSKEKLVERLSVQNAA